MRAATAFLQIVFLATMVAAGVLGDGGDGHIVGGKPSHEGRGLMADPNVNTED